VLGIALGRAACVGVPHKNQYNNQNRTAADSGAGAVLVPVDCDVFRRPQASLVFSVEGGLRLRLRDGNGNGDLSLSLSKSQMPTLYALSQADNALTIEHEHEHSDSQALARESSLTTLSEMLSTSDAWKAFFSSSSSSSDSDSDSQGSALLSVSTEPALAAACGDACATYTALRTEGEEVFGLEGKHQHALKLPRVDAAEIAQMLEASAAAGTGIFHSLSHILGGSARYDAATQTLTVEMPASNGKKKISTFTSTAFLHELQMFVSVAEKMNDLKLSSAVPHFFSFTASQMATVPEQEEQVALALLDGCLASVIAALDTRFHSRVLVEVALLDTDMDAQMTHVINGRRHLLSMDMAKANLAKGKSNSTLSEEDVLQYQVMFWTWWMLAFAVVATLFAFAGMEDWQRAPGSGIIASTYNKKDD
jgi:hypothetical protein